MTLLGEIETYLRALREAGAPIAESTFGMRAASNSYLVARLRSGGDVRLKTAARIRRFIEANPPPPAKKTPSTARVGPNGKARR